MPDHDLVEDLRGKVATVFTATSSGIDRSNMHFKDPVRVSGLDMPYGCHFAAGWSASDYDSDTYGPGNCVAQYSGVTQHYCGCWNMNVGSDADTSGGDTTDQGVGPHAHITAVITPLGLAGDGSDYSRVRRLSRFVKW